MTQGDAAGTDMSTAYISRIEAGQRRPAADLLIALAERLHCTPEELLAPDDSVVSFDAAVVARLTLELDYADLSLRTGDAAAALERADAVLREASKTSAVPPELRAQAHVLRALALEAVGRNPEAIEALETVVADDDDPLRLMQAFTALSRCYRSSGDFSRAADIGDRAGAVVDGRQLHGSAEGLKLAVTVAAAHFERGDINHAVRICQRALSHAEELDSPEARAAAYWNTSVMESRQGHVAAALPMAEKALALLETAEDARSQTRLRIQLGLLHLRTDPPLVDEALAILDRAQDEARYTDINASDRAELRIGLARANYFAGDFATAGVFVEAELAGDDSGFTRTGVEALLLRAQISAGRGESGSAVTDLSECVTRLHALPDQYGIAQLWFEVGTLLDEHGLYREAAQAYRSAGSSNGLTRASVRPAVTATT